MLRQPGVCTWTDLPVANFPVHLCAVQHLRDYGTFSDSLVLSIGTKKIKKKLKSLFSKHSELAHLDCLLIN
jgi:hypothetical protein